MKAQLSARELAAMGLPGLPASEQNMRARAEREGWAYVDVPARGRTGTRREYPVATLPADLRRAVQAAALASAVTSVTSSAARATPAAAFTPAGDVSLPLSSPAVPFSEADLTDKQRLERDARTGVLAALRALQGATGCTQDAAITTLLTNARAGRLDAATDRLLRLARDPRGRAGDGYPSARTLKRWIGADTLAPKAPRADMAVPPWAAAFLAEYRRPEKPSVADAYADACRVWGRAERPSIHQVRRWLSKVGAVTREAGRMGPRELKNIQPFVRRDFSLLEPNDVWSADGHTFDAEVQHPFHGRPFRPEITVFVDIATRRAVGWSVDLAESSTAVADALRWGVERHGVPALIYVDNGSGYRNAAMNDAALGLVGRIGATMTHSLPYNSQARGVIERLHQTLWVTGAKALPGYIGAAMDREARLAQFRLSRKAIKGGGAMPLMPWELFVQWVQQRVDDYNARPHRSLGGTSPDLRWRAHEVKGWTPVTVAADVLDTLFRPRVERTVARGELVLMNNRYFSRDLAEFHGQPVHVAYDIHDPARVWVYWPDGRLIGTADVDGNRKHYFPVAVVEQARQNRAKGRLDRVEAKREEILAELAGSAALPAPQAAPMVIGGRVVTPEEVRATRKDVIDAPAAAAPAAAPSPAAPASAPPRRSRSEMSPDEIYADWLRIGAALQAGDAVTEFDRNFHRRWPESAPGRAWFQRLDAEQHPEKGRRANAGQP